MDTLTRLFLDERDEQKSVDLVRTARIQELYSLGIYVGTYVKKFFPKNRHLRNELGIMLYHSKRYEEANAEFSSILELRGLNEQESYEAVFNKHFCAEYIRDRYTYYNKDIVSLIKQHKLPTVTFTITTCKRFDLFEKTINSFINCCQDIHLIDEWFCVDDNSSEEDREKMKSLYPFFTFYFKNLSEKGHPQSMNIIRNHVITPFIFHVEDDWQFIEKRDYISECMEVLGQDSNFGQCLINKNYAELAVDCHKIKGGEFRKTDSGLRYYIHEYCPTDEDKIRFMNKYGNGNSCNYWPHFSFRPSLVRTRIYKEL